MPMDRDLGISISTYGPEYSKDVSDALANSFQDIDVYFYLIQYVDVLADVAESESLPNPEKNPKHCLKYCQAVISSENPQVSYNFLYVS